MRERKDCREMPQQHISKEELIETAEARCWRAYESSVLCEEAHAEFAAAVLALKQLRAQR